MRLPNEPDKIKNKRIVRKTVPCWASEAWRRDTLDAIRRLIDHVEASPYAGRVIGYHLASGESHEWFMWGSAVDWSKPNLAAYRRWLGNAYRTDERSVRPGAARKYRSNCGASRCRGTLQVRLWRFARSYPGTKRH